jgi:hypothetical protein
VAGGALAFTAFVPPLNPLAAPFNPQLYNWRDGKTHSAPSATRPAPEAATAVKGREAPPADKTAVIGPPPRPDVRPAANAEQVGLATWQVIAAQLFWVNWMLLLLNLLPGFPLDGGRVLQAILWWRSDYRQAMSGACYAGFIVMLVIGVFAIVQEDVLAFALCLFVYMNCKQQLIVLETGGEDAPFGYDFSQGYTSLEGAPPAAPPKRRRPNWFQRWMQKRAARRAQRELEQRESEERRMDELLEKVQREGLQALTDEERRFLTRVSARYRGGKS